MAKRAATEQAPSARDPQASRQPRQPRLPSPPRPRQAARRVLHPDAGGLDIGAETVYAALPPDRAECSVRSFSTFTLDLYDLAAWLKEHRVTTVAMESTGVFWIPVFQILERCGIEVYLVNARHVKNVPGRKTDVSDCQWLQYLHSVGLLQASFRPADVCCAIRAITRHRDQLVKAGAQHLQHMQKSLTQMNLQLHHVLSDLAGVTGLAIIDALLQGERDPAVLAGLRDRRVKATEETVRQALLGDYRGEHLFTLGLAREAYQFVRQQLQACDAEIERRLQAFVTAVDPEVTPPPPPTARPAKPRKGEIALPADDLRTELYRIYGTDLTQTPALGASTVCALLAELGTDLAKPFGNADRFVSWLGLCPNPQISGGRVLRKGTRDVKHRVATLFRVAAQSLHHSQCALGQFYRRMRSKLGPAPAITATAHKLARIFFHLVTTREAYDESLFAHQEQQYEQRRLQRLKREAAELGYTLATAPEPATDPPVSCLEPGVVS